jgi:hypothetical protein
MTRNFALFFVLLTACNIPFPDEKDTDDTGDTADTADTESPLPDPVLWLQFDDSPGWLENSTGNGDLSIAAGTPQAVNGLSGGGIEFRIDRADELSIEDVTIPSDCAWTLTTWFLVGEQENWDDTRVLLGATADMQHFTVDAYNPVVNGPGGETRSDIDFRNLAPGWHHLGVIVDCNDRTSIALNGNIEDTLSVALRLPITRIGNSGFGTDWQESWGGVIDDFRLYDEALTEDHLGEILNDL